MFISFLPGAIGFKLRYRFWKNRLKFLGKNVKIDVGVYFQNPQFISIDDNCWIDRNVIILAGPPGSKRITYSKTNSEFIG
jgi:acetyltransferase-like isoleucine patch superfamily enzyme